MTEGQTTPGNAIAEHILYYLNLACELDPHTVNHQVCKPHCIAEPAYGDIETGNPESIRKVIVPLSKGVNMLRNEVNALHLLNIMCEDPHRVIMPNTRDPTTGLVTSFACYWRSIEGMPYTEAIVERKRLCRIRE